MGRKVKLVLKQADRIYLQEIFALGCNWRERQRAQTLILLDDGLCLGEVAELVGIHIRTVGLTRMDWLARGAVSLVDRAHTGAPKKINPSQLNFLLDAARTEALTAKALLAKHIGNGGEMVHLNTLKVALRTSKFVWKRTRHSLKKTEMKTPSELHK